MTTAPAGIEFDWERCARFQHDQPERRHVWALRQGLSLRQAGRRVTDLRALGGQACSPAQPDVGEARPMVGVRQAAPAVEMVVRFEEDRGDGTAFRQIDPTTPCGGRRRPRATEAAERVPNVRRVAPRLAGAGECCGGDRPRAAGVTRVLCAVGHGPSHGARHEDV